MNHDAGPSLGIVRGGDGIFRHLRPLGSSAAETGDRLQWAEMTENAIAATHNTKGGARIVIHALKSLLAGDSSIEIHVAGHSAGAVFMGPVVQALAKFTKISTCHLWAPACTTDFFRQHYLPLINGPKKSIQDFALYTLTDMVERDDHCAHLYHKSLLYLVSRACEDEYRPFVWGWAGAPLLGMERCIREDKDISALFAKAGTSWILSPNTSDDALHASRSTSHGGFDDDRATVQGALTRILGKKPGIAPPLRFGVSASRTKDCRMNIKTI